MNTDPVFYFFIFCVRGKNPKPGGSRGRRKRTRTLLNSGNGPRYEPGTTAPAGAKTYSSLGCHVGRKRAKETAAAIGAEAGAPTYLSIKVVLQSGQTSRTPRPHRGAGTVTSEACGSPELEAELKVPARSSSRLRPARRLHLRTACEGRGPQGSVDVLPDGVLMAVCALRPVQRGPGACLATRFHRSHPLVPEHGGFRCQPSPCRGFPHNRIILYFCEPGYSLPQDSPGSARCRHGRWTSAVPGCVSIPAPWDPLCCGTAGAEQLPWVAREVLPSGGWSPDPEDQNTNTNTLPGVAMTAVSVSIFLVTTTACVVIKSRLHPCHSERRSSDQLDLMIDGGPVPLPSYEEAVYGSRGERIPPSQGPTQLLLAREPPGLHPSHAGPGSQPETTCLCPLANQTTTLAPPPYEEVQSESRGGVGREFRQELRIAVASHKDNSADTCCQRGTDNYSMV
ncbi:SUSD6 protein, partial [Atractosteus spatula]|nr:SUSD6 protein [Atractosteus spatula]